MIYGIGDVIYIRFRLQQQNIACTTAAASRSTTLYTDQYSAVYDNQLWMYENGFYYISTRYGCIGIVQSERMINAHMICTQKQMKDIRGMRIDKDRDDNCINYTPYISTEYSLHQLLTLIVSSRHIFFSNRDKRDAFLRWLLR